MNFFVALLLLFGLCAAVSAQQGLVPSRCNFADPAVANKHLTHITRLNQPGDIWILNTTIFANSQPGLTDFVAVNHTHTYQYNTREGNLAGCYFKWLKVDERLPGQWGFGTWIGEVDGDQLLLEPTSKQRPQPMRASYKVQALAPVFFEQIGALYLQIESRNIGAFAEATNFLIPLEDGTEFNVLLEAMGPTPRSISTSTFDEYAYVNIFFSGDNAGYTMLETIHSVRLQCADYAADSEVGRACTARDQFLAGNAFLAQDPRATEAGVENYPIWTWIEPNAEEVSAKHEATWPQTTLAATTYELIMNGKVKEVPNGIEFMAGMHLSEEDHNAKLAQLRK